MENTPQTPGGPAAGRAAPSSFVVPYVRVSTDDQANSLEAQTRVIGAWAAARGLPCLDPFVDEDVSGARPIADRPGLGAALATLRPGAMLTVAKRDRLARDIMVVGMVERLAVQAGASIVSVAGEGTDGADPDDPANFLLRKIIDIFAEFERLTIKARTRLGLKNKRANGRRVGTVPLGRALVDDGQRSKKSDRPNGLGDNPAELAALDRAVELYAADVSPREIGRRLLAEGFPARNGREWAHTTIRAVLKKRGVYRPAPPRAGKAVGDA